MQIVRHPSELRPSNQPVCIAIGVFDGVHLGHQSVLQRMLRDAREIGARSVVVTFDRHPRSLLAPASTPKLIQTQRQKLRSFEKAGVDATWMIPFDLEFSRIPGREFIVQMGTGFGNVSSISVGRDFHFGHARSGNATLLDSWGRELGFKTHGLPALEMDGAPVSSTRVRNAIQSGNLDAASKMLGRPYSLAGTVIHGDHLGTELGFPTANLDCTEVVTPPSGVYHARCSLSDQTIKAAVNIGCRPSVKSPTPTLRIEAHLLDWQGDLYGREIELEFVQRLRDEQKFPSLEALKMAINRDLATIREEV